MSEKGWRVWKNDHWERPSLSQMIEHVVNRDIDAVMEYGEIEERINGKMSDLYESEVMKDFQPQNLREQTEIFDVFAERIRAYRTGKININEIFNTQLEEDEKGNV